MHGTKQTNIEPHVLVKYENYKGTVFSSLGISATQGDTSLCFDLCCRALEKMTGCSDTGSNTRWEFNRELIEELGDEGEDV